MTLLHNSIYIAVTILVCSVTCLFFFLVRRKVIFTGGIGVHAGGGGGWGEVKRRSGASGLSFNVFYEIFGKMAHQPPPPAKSCPYAYHRCLCHKQRGNKTSWSSDRLKVGNVLMTSSF